MEAVVVLEWHVSVGDTVAEGDLLVTVETAKAAVDIEAPLNGVLSSIRAEPETEVATTDILGTIGMSVEDTEVTDSPTQDAPVEAVAEASEIAAPKERPQHEPLLQPSGDRILASPAARIAAKERGLDLTGVVATSSSGRIKLRDLPDADSALPVVSAPTTRVRETGPLKIYRSGSETGTPILMLHGFASDAQSWSFIERALARQRPVIRIDLPNHGKSPKRPVDGFRRLAREVVEAFDSLGLEAAHLLGHSLGGACALALADIRPRRMASLTLIAPGGLGPQINHDFLNGLARASRPESLEAWLKIMVYDEKLIGMDFVAAAMASRRDATLREAQLRMSADVFPDGTPGFDLRGVLERLTCPARIIWGKADRVIPWRDALSAPGNVGLHLFDRVGHVPQLEIPEAVLSILNTIMGERRS